MKSSISLPFLKLESMVNVSRLNNYITTYESDGEKLTQEKLASIISEYDGNAMKHLQLIKVLFAHTYRNKLEGMEDSLIEFLKTVVQDITENNKQSAISLLRDIASLRIMYENKKQGGVNKYHDVVLEELLVKLKGGNEVTGPEITGESLAESDIRMVAMTNALMETLQEYEQGTIQTESIKMTARKVKDKVTNTIVKYTLKDKEMSEKLNEKFNRYINEYKENKKISAYDKIVKDSMNLSRFLKNLFTSSLVAILIPGGVQTKLIAGAIAMLVKFAMDKRTESKYKRMILADLKFEQKILREKIRDAESKGDTKAKYKLMRIENDVARAIDRVRFGLQQPVDKSE